MIPSVEMGKKVTDNYDIIPNDVKEKTVLSGTAIRQQLSYDSSGEGGHISS